MITDFLVVQFAIDAGKLPAVVREAFPLRIGFGHCRLSREPEGTDLNVFHPTDPFGELFVKDDGSGEKNLFRHGMILFPASSLDRGLSFLIRKYRRLPR